MTRPPHDKPAQGQQTKAGKAKARKPLQVLLVDLKPEVCDVVEQLTRRHDAVRISTCKTLAEARQRLADGPVDLALIHDDAPDGSGLSLAEELDRSRKITKTIVVSDAADADQAVAAIRAGAADFVTHAELLDDSLDALDERLQKLIQRHKHDKQKAQRVRRLRRVCRKLNDARQEVADQVEHLCTDLVAAYQELAEQVHETQHQQTYQSLVEGELDFESLLRKTLEYIVEQVGPTNAAIFLPTTPDEYSLGGYVNYDCGSNGPDFLLQHLADVLAPRLAEQPDLVVLSDERALQHWLGDDASWLEGSHVVGMPCMDRDECLGVVVLFRDASNPFTQAAAETLHGMGPILATALAKVIRVHHRALPEPDSDSDYGSWDDNLAA